MEDKIKVTDLLVGTLLVSKALPIVHLSRERQPLLEVSNSVKTTNVCPTVPKRHNQTGSNKISKWVRQTLLRRVRTANFVAF